MPFNDTWQFDGTRWLLVDHVGDLPPVWGGTMVYDPGSRQLILFGGADAILAEAHTSTNSAATRVFDGSSWRTLSTIDVPYACYPPVVAFDTGRGVLVDYDGCYSENHELQRPADLDGDGIANGVDNCPLVANPDQADSDGDGVGDGCDNCVAVPNAVQRNLDGDTYGDACDFCPLDPDDMHIDSDGDGIGDECDCLPLTPGSGLPPEVGATVDLQHHAGDPATTIQWTADGGVPLYEMYVGTIPANMMGSRGTPYDDRCLTGGVAPAGGTLTTTDAAAPAVGTARYYLLSGKNDCGEGTLGAASTDVPRPAPYPCDLPHPTPPVIADVQVSASTSTSICPEYDSVFRGWLCDLGIPPDMYTLVPGPSIEVRTTSTDATIQVFASESGPNGANAESLSVQATYPYYTSTASLSIPDDGSLAIAPAMQAQGVPEYCGGGSGTDICTCSDGYFSVTSHDPLAGDHVFTRQFDLLWPSASLPSSQEMAAALQNCTYRRSNSTQVLMPITPGVPVPFTIDVWDDAGNVTTWPVPLPIGGQTSTLVCSGDACACCLFFSTDASECRGQVGLLGVPGSGFETGLCNSL
jgi:hypothetical protein